MEHRTITLHAFCSAKGGVGKSTLAVACARLLADSGRRCVLIDADLTGSSIADGLRLCAPERPGGPLDLGAPGTGRYLTRAETVQARNARKNVAWEETPPAPPFFNDILRYGNEDSAECCIEGLLWKHEDEDGVQYLPSSPLRKDVLTALGWLYYEEQFAWLQRLTWLLDGMRQQMPDLRDVVIDLPPGLFGFAHETLALLSSLRSRTPLPSGFPALNAGGTEWEGNPFLVTTQDRNDVVLALEYYLAHRDKLPHLTILLNRYTEGAAAGLSETIQEHFGAALGLDALLRWRVSEAATLREVFTSGRLRITEEARTLRAALQLERSGWQ
ncbi:P-loop NTPase [Sorangium sp. So ce1182]|uniref:P-loop NTPase n=1 Tax=Sorangium sp. So ce1182 TaxID=3133334 RepID=UPI003F63C369